MTRFAAHAQEDRPRAPALSAPSQESDAPAAPETNLARMAVGVEYDGAEFHGWQSQPRARNVQDCVERALAAVADAPVRVVCSGRTDAGVHACGQVAHFTTAARRSEAAWVRGANSRLPRDVAVRWALPVADDFHARYSALRRHYRYVIVNCPARPALARGLAAWELRPLDEARMRAAAAALVGEHDFSAFRAAGCQSRTPRRQLFEIDVRRAGDRVWIDLCANAFLQRMARNIAGALIEIGAGERSAEWAGELLRARDRRLAAATAPACGLYLRGVEYPARHRLPGPPAWRMSVDLA